jgi:hypothetical protein
MCIDHIKCFVKAEKTSERVIKNTMGFLKQAITNGSINEAEWLLMYIVLPKYDLGELINSILR